MNMEQKFDEMSLPAMEQADQLLAHIAATETLPTEQTVRLIAGTSQKLHQQQRSEQIVRLPDIRPKKHRLRLAGILIAAALSVSALSLAVSGSKRYSQFVMERYFGSSGEARLAAMHLPAQQTVSNGTVSARAEAFLYDGHRAVALVTFETVDASHPIDWLKQMRKANLEKGFLCYNCTVLDEQGRPLGTAENPLTADDPFWSMGESGAYCREKGSFTTEITFLMPKSAEPGQITLRFSDETHGTLDVPVVLGEQLDAVTLTNGGQEMYLSPIGMTMNTGTGYEDHYGLTLTDRSGSVRHAVLETLQSGTCPWKENAHYTQAKLYEVPEGAEFEYGKAETYSAYMDVSDVVTAEWNGTVFVREP